MARSWYRPRLEVFEERALPCTIQWTNLAGGSWAVPTNWDLGRLPGPADDVCLNVPGDVTVTRGTPAGDTIRSLTSHEALSITNGTLALTAASVMHNTLTLAGGWLSGSGNLTVHGTLSWSGGGMADAGRTIIDTGGRLHVRGDGDKLLWNGRTLSNAGQALWTENGTLAIHYGGTLLNEAGGTFDVQGNGAVAWREGAEGVVRNLGTFRKTAGTGTLVIGPGSGRVTLDNRGTLEVRSGTLNPAAGSTSSGTYLAAAGGTIQFSTGNHTFLTGTTFAGDGVIRMVGGRVDILGTQTVSGNFELAGGWLGHNGTLNWSSGTLTWTGGGMADMGRTVIGANARLHVRGTGDKLLWGGRTLSNAGQVLWTDNGTIAFYYGGTLVNETGGTFDVQGNGSIAWREGDPVTQPAAVRNLGTFRKTAGTGTTAIGPGVGRVAFDNSGTVEARSGVLAVGGGTSSGTFVATPQGTIHFNGNHTLSGTLHTTAAGAIIQFSDGNHAFLNNARFTGDGSIRMVGGRVNVTGTQSVSGNFELAGGWLGHNGTLIWASGTFTWSGGGMADSGRTIIGTSARLHIRGTADKLLWGGRTLSNAGQAVWTDNGTIAFYYGGTLVNDVGGTFDVQGNGAVAWREGDPVMQPAAVRNLGTFRKTAGTATTTIGPGVGRVPFDNSGTVDVRSGVLNLAAGGISSGTFIAAPGGLVDFSGGVHTFSGTLHTTAAGAVIQFSGGSNPLRTGARFTGDGVTRLVGGRIDVLGNQTASGDFELAGGWLGHNGTLTWSSGTLTWTGGGMADMGRTVIGAGARLHVRGTADKLLWGGRTLSNAGQALWTDNGTIAYYYGGTLVNEAGGTFDVQGNGSIAWREGDPVAQPAAVRNLGTFRKTAGTATTTIGPGVGRVPFDNSGTVDVRSGTLRLAAGGSSGGTFAPAAAGVVEFSGGNHTLLTGTRFAGDGVSSLTGAHLIVTGAATVTGIFEIVGGGLTVNGTLTVPGILDLFGGGLGGSGTVTVSGLMTWFGGVMVGSGSTVIADSGLLFIGGEGYKELQSRTLRNAGYTFWFGPGQVVVSAGAVLVNEAAGFFEIDGAVSFRWQFGDEAAIRNAGTFSKWGSGAAVVGLAQGRVSFQNTGTVEVWEGVLHLGDRFLNFAGGTLTGGVYEVFGTLQFTNADVRTNAAALTLYGPGAQVVNQFHGNGLANLAANAASGRLTLLDRSLTTAGAFQNAGALTVGAGSTFTVRGSYTQTAGTTTLDFGTLSASGLVDLQGGSLNGSGFVQASVRNAGVLRVGGTGSAGDLAVEGNYTQTGGGRLELELGDFDAGAYDQLLVGGTATLGGILAVALLDGFTPRAGDGYRVLDCSSRAGSFATLDLPDPGSGLTLDGAYDEFGLTLWVS